MCTGPRGALTRRGCPNWLGGDLQQAQGPTAQRPVFGLAPLCLTSFVSVACWVGAASGKHQTPTQLVSHESWARPSVSPGDPGSMQREESGPRGSQASAEQQGSGLGTLPPTPARAASRPRFTRKDKPCKDFTHMKSLEGSTPGKRSNFGHKHSKNGKLCACVRASV